MVERKLKDTDDIPEAPRGSYLPHLRKTRYTAFEKLDGYSYP